MDVLDVTRTVTAVSAVVALGANTYVCYQAVKMNRAAHKVIAAWAYPLMAAVTCLAIAVGRTRGALVSEPGLQLTDITATPVVVLALYAGWQATSRIADLDEDRRATDLLQRVLDDEAAYQEKHPDVRVDPRQKDED